MNRFNVASGRHHFPDGFFCGRRVIRCNDPNFERPRLGSRWFSRYANEDCSMAFLSLLSCNTDQQNIARSRVRPEKNEFAAAIIVEPLDAPHAGVLAILKNPSRPRHTWLTRAPASSAAREPPYSPLRTVQTSRARSQPSA